MVYLRKLTNYIPAHKSTDMKSWLVFSPNFGNVSNIIVVFCAVLARSIMKVGQ